MTERDRLIEQIFDEGVTPSGREAELLSGIKADLARLRGNVPECQLTAEHLRRAVLNQPQRKGFNFQPWLWTSLAAAACLSALFAVWPKGGKPEAASVVHTVAARSDSPAPRIDQPAPLTRSPLERLVVQSPEKPRPKRSQRRARSSAHTQGAVASLSRVASFNAEKAVVGQPATILALDIKSEPEPVVHEPVVVVTDKPSPSTGAAEAQEISKPSDVVFGG